MSTPNQATTWQLLELPPRPADPPSGSLITRYGPVRLTAHSANRIQVSGQLSINNCDHKICATLHRRDTSSVFHLGEDHDDPRPVEQRTREVDLQREWSTPAASLSARRKATVEIDRAVKEWAATPDARSLLSDAETWSAAHAAWGIGLALADAAKREAQARSERVHAAQALAELTPTRTPLCSPLSPDEACVAYRELIASELAEILCSLPPHLHRHLERLTAITGLVRPAPRSTDPRLWDVLTALREVEAS